eukprot:6103851-Amphidinium_carterae.1
MEVSHDADYMVSDEDTENDEEGFALLETFLDDFFGNVMNEEATGANGEEDAVSHGNECDADEEAVQDLLSMDVSNAELEPPPESWAE